MKFLPIIDRYLPNKLAYHLKIVLSSIVIAAVFEWILTGRLFSNEFLLILLILIFQMEVFMWLGLLFFGKIKNTNIKDYTKKVLLNLFLYYISVLLIATILFVATNVFYHVFTVGSIETYDFRSLISKYDDFLLPANVGIMGGVLLFFFISWQESLKREQKLKEESLIFQYETLKNQVNPHFLFNSLNTLSSLVSTQPLLAEKFINKLSSIYRYVLENKDNDLVSLESELSFVKDYFYLQQIRDEEKISLSLDIVNIENYSILPLSLQILVENALKHNIATRDQRLNIKIFIEQENIVVLNNLQKKKLLGKTSQLGLKNLGQRINLLLHKELEIIENTEEFVVKVPLKIVNPEQKLKFSSINTTR